MNHLEQTRLAAAAAITHLATTCEHCATPSTHTGRAMRAVDAIADYTVEILIADGLDLPKRTKDPQ